MRPLYDDLEDFDFDDSAVMDRFRREQAREQRRLAHRRVFGAAGRNRDYDDYEDLDDFGDYDDFEDYDEDEFDEHAGLAIDH